MKHRILHRSAAASLVVTLLLPLLFPSAALAAPTGLPDHWAAYDGQATCDPVAKAGLVRLETYLLARYPTTASYGITRPCDVGGVSEHKEGRALDWRVSALDPKQKAVADAFLAELLGPDVDGRPAVLARRIGVMYVIWNEQIWSASRADEGWRRYYGASPHTDHVHFSLSWAGALEQTSFFAQDLDDPAAHWFDPAIVAKETKARRNRAEWSRNEYIRVARRYRRAEPCAPSQSDQIAEPASGSSVQDLTPCIADAASTDSASAQPSR